MTINKYLLPALGLLAAVALWPAGGVLAQAVPSPSDYGAQGETGETEQPESEAVEEPEGEGTAEPAGETAEEPAGQTGDQAADAEPARAEQFGDSSERALGEEDLAGLTCDDLWIARNEIFARKGYCFKSERAVQYFDVSGCTADSVDILSDLEWKNVDLIKAAEKRQQCR